VAGAAVLDKWNFSDDLIQCVIHHEEMPIGQEDNEVQYRLAAMVNLPDNICAYLGIGAIEPDESIDVLNCTGASALVLDKSQVVAAISQVDETFSENRDNFQS